VKYKFLFLIPIILFILIAAVPETILAEDEEVLAEKKALEITYPEIPGVSTPEYVDAELPDYVNYAFRFSLVIIGFLIFGVIIYNGIKYLTSFGNPAKLSDAKQGIIAAALGSIVLLGSYIIFNTINPQLVTLTNPSPDAIKAKITPGAYICNKVIDIPSILSKYTSENNESRNEAAQELKDEMGKPGDKEACFLINFSSIFKNFTIKANSDDWTLFIVPIEKYNTEKKEFYWEYEHGIVLHENDNFGGRCKVFPEEQLLYGQVEDPHPKIDFEAKAVTLFQKLSTEPIEEAKGIILYEGPAYNEIGKQDPEESDIELNPTGSPMGIRNSFYAFAATDPNLKSANFKPATGKEALFVPESELKSKGLWHETRSIEFSPPNTYIAILQGAENKCEVRRANDSTLLNDPIGKCGNCNLWSYLKIWDWANWKNCYPCLESMYVIKGNVI
jgi:hypothetical protein